MPSMEFTDQTAWHGAYVAVGSFDGVHRGHRLLLEQMVRSAREDHSPAVAVTFFPHPRAFFAGAGDAPPFRYLTTLEDRLSLLESTGLDAVLTQPFHEAFSRTSAAAFLERLKLRLGMRSLWCGPGFTFGFRREGNTAFLTEQSLALGFQTYVMPPLVDGGEPVSSTRIRGLLAQGDVAGAARLLGRRFELRGTIVHGAGRGHTIGFPTANLSPWAESVVPGNGIYVTRTTGMDGRHASVTSIGVRPTFAEQSPAATIETYLLDYEGDVYGQELRLEFHTRLRDELRFENSGALREQIQRDVDQARLILQEAV